MSANGGMMDGMTGPHWQFALAVYGKPGVPAACLLLQDRCGVDVNVLLVGLYAAAVGIGPDRNGIAALDDGIRAIRETAVLPLRQVRRGMKGRDFGPATEMVRQQVQKAELMAEQLEQAALAALLARQPATTAVPLRVATAVAANILAHFAAVRGVTPDAEALAALETVVQAAEEYVA